MATRSLSGWWWGLRCVLALGLVLLGSGAARGSILIDDFESGPLNFVDSTPGAGTEYLSQSLPTSHVVGGARHLELYGNATPTQMTLNVTAGDDALNLTAPNTSTYFYVIYNGNPSSGGATPNLNLDLRNMDRFELTFARIDRAMGFRIRVRAGNAFPSAYTTVSQPGLVQVPLTAFGSVNWADIDMIRLEIQTSYQYQGTTHTESLADFRIVPEPASLFLLALGGLRLRRCRR